MRKFMSLFLMVCALITYAASAFAEVPKNVVTAVTAAYPPAIDHRGLYSAYEQPDLDKLRGFVVMEQGGIPAERARYYITWSDYDYRGVVIHLNKDDEMTTRRGDVYTFLKKGDVMAVAGVKDFHDTIYLKLLSSEVYVPENRSLEKRHSRVTVMLGFKFPKEILKRGDANEILGMMAQWAKPFPNLESAQVYAKGLTPAAEAVTAKAPQSKGKTSKSEAVAPASTSAEDAQMKALEEKIDAARRDLDKAQKELGDIKKSKTKQED